jgi:uncharacterized protein GlcG (DUF336 family)
LICGDNAAGLASQALSLPELCAFQGGVPIKAGDEVIGAARTCSCAARTLACGEQGSAIATEAAGSVMWAPVTHRHFRRAARSG